MSREMKDSGVEWIGEIPEEFDVREVKNIFNIGRGRVIAKTKIEPLNNGALYPVYSSQTVNNGCMGYTHTYDYEQDGLTWTTDGANAGTVFLRTGKFNCTNVCGILTAKDKNKFYLPYFAYSVNLSAINSRRSDILGYKVMSNEMAHFKVTYPTDYNEQIQIANFLDRKCTAIDTAIEKTKKSIEKLEEYKKAVITKAVTKGINPNARMKDAHFLWLTAIPENWGIYKLNHILDYNHPYPLGDGDHGSIKADSYVSSGIPFIRVQNLGYAEPINIENVVYITEAQNQKIQNSTLAPNDILFAKTGATIGKTAIMPQTISRANTTSHIGKITVDTRYYVPKYIFYALSSEIGNHQLWSIANKKATRPEVGLDEVKYIKLCIPLSVTEQKQIADFLDEKLNQINNAISNHANLIRKLEEYKKSLIYYAVTGKIDCRGEKL